MQLVFHALKNGLEQERKVYARLLELGLGKKEALVKNDIDAINKTLEQETECMKKLRELNTIQMGNLDRLAEHFHLDHRPNLSEIISLTDDEAEKRKLREMQDAFHALIKEFRSVNEQNQKLLETQMQYTDFCLELLTQEETVGDLYSNSGRVNEEPVQRRGIIDWEA